MVDIDPIVVDEMLQMLREPDCLGSCIGNGTTEADVVFEIGEAIAVGNQIIDIDFTDAVASIGVAAVVRGETFGHVLLLSL
jgi:hypothetical protein